MTLVSDELTTGRTFQRQPRTFWVLGTQCDILPTAGAMLKCIGFFAGQSGKTKLAASNILKTGSPKKSV